MPKSRRKPVSVQLLLAPGVDLEEWCLPAHDEFCSKLGIETGVARGLLDDAFERIEAAFSEATVKAAGQALALALADTDEMICRFNIVSNDDAFDVQFSINIGPTNGDQYRYAIALSHVVDSMCDEVEMSGFEDVVIAEARLAASILRKHAARIDALCEEWTATGGEEAPPE